MKSKYAAILVTCSSLMLGLTGSLPVAAEELPATTFVTEENNNQQTTQQNTSESEINNSEIDEMLDKIFSNEEYIQRMFERIHQTYGGQKKGGKGFRMQNPQLNDQAAPESQATPENQTAPENQVTPDGQTAPGNQITPENQIAPGGDSTPFVPGNGQMPRRHQRSANNQSLGNTLIPQNGVTMTSPSEAA